MFILAGYLLFLCLVGLGFAQDIDDPVEKFCRRFGHQTALIDRKLYIDGGIINYNPLTDSESTNRTSMAQSCPVSAYAWPLPRAAESDAALGS